jgi:hypothetical protein
MATSGTASSTTTPISTDPVVADPSNWLLTGDIKSLAKQYGIKNDKWYRNNMFKNLSFGMYPRLAQSVNFGNTLEPMRQNAIVQGLTALNPANTMATIDAYKRNQEATAVDSNRLLDLTLGGSGLSSGAIEGAKMANLGMAQNQTNSYMGQLLSPEGIQKSIQAYLSLIGGGQNVSGLDNLLNLANGQRTVSSGDGWSNLLGAGMQAAALFPK